MANRFVGDAPRHDQYSYVGDLSVAPIGWNTNSSGDINQPGQTIPPQFFVERIGVGVPQQYRVRCPRGNAKNMFAMFTADGGQTCTVLSFGEAQSEDALPSFVVTMSAEITALTRIRGYIAYSLNAANARKGSGVVESNHNRPMASQNRYKARGLLRQTMMYPVGWVTDGDALGNVESIRAPLGVTIEHVDSSPTYKIQFPVNFRSLSANWTDLVATSTNRPFTVSYLSGSPQAIEIAFDAPLSAGERAGIMFVGSVSQYPTNYGATVPGGVYPDLKSRDIANYSHYPQGSPLRDSCFIPLHIRFSGIDLVNPFISNLPPGISIEFLSGTTYQMSIGSFPENGIIAALNYNDGDVTIDNVDNVAGTFEFTLAVAASADTSVVQGFIMAVTQNVP